jgi:hypothetical protein
VINALGNHATIAGTLIIDTTAPIITLNGDATMNLTVGDTYTEQGATTTDNIDANVAVTTGGDTVDTSVVGTYHVTYDAVDTAGNHAAEVIRTVNIAAVPVVAPVVTPQTGVGGGGVSFSAGGGSSSSSTSSTRAFTVLDFNTLMIHWGQNGVGIPGDFNGDGKVDILDFNMLLINLAK